MKPSIKNYKPVALVLIRIIVLLWLQISLSRMLWEASKDRVVGRVS